MSQKTMQAGVFVEPGRLELRQVPLPQPREGEVLLKVLGCGVCGTDYHIFEGAVTEGVGPPVSLGHEIAVRVEQPGPAVEGLAVGQFAAVDPVVGCGQCSACREGQTNLCTRPTIIGYRRDGGFAEYLTAPASHVVAMNEAVGPAGGILCETLACVVRGYDRLQFTAGRSVLILGAGTVGLLWTAMFQHTPTALILQSEPIAYRREKARQLGADVVIDPHRIPIEQAVGQHLPEGVDYIIDATGNPAAIARALPLLGRGGTLMVFGVCPPGHTLPIDPHEMFVKELTVIGSKMPPQALDRAARLIEAGRVPVDQIVTTHVGFDELVPAVKGFESLRDQRVKTMLDPAR